MKKFVFALMLVIAVTLAATVAFAADRTPVQIFGAGTRGADGSYHVRTETAKSYTYTDYEVLEAHYYLKPNSPVEKYQQTGQTFTITCTEATFYLLKTVTLADEADVWLRLKNFGTLKSIEDGKAVVFTFQPPAKNAYTAIYLMTEGDFLTRFDYDGDANGPRDRVVLRQGQACTIRCRQVIPLQ